MKTVIDSHTLIWQKHLNISMISFPVLARSRFDLHTEMIQRCALGPRVIPPSVTTILVVAFGFQTKLK